MNKQTEADLLVGGMQPLTLIDFPGRLSSVIFTQGCNLKCRFCYNKSLLAPCTCDYISWGRIIDFLKERQGFVEGVVFSGGEPCLQSGLLEAMNEVKELGFEIGLHTNGFFYNVIKKALNKGLLNFIAIDFKAPFEKYKSVCGSAIKECEYKKLVKTVVESGIRYELRTTVHPALLTDADVLKMGEWLADKGVSTYAVQKFRYGKALDLSLGPVFSECVSNETLNKLKGLFKNFILRSDEADSSESVKAA